MAGAVSSQDAPGPDIVPTGIPGLDNVLRGGLPRGHLYLVEGDAGAGKTTLGLQFLLEGKRRGETVLWCTLSETEKQLEATARSHGWDLAGIEIQNLTRTEVALGADAEYSFFSPADIELGDVTRAVMETVDRLRPGRVVFDPFTDVRLLARDPLRYRRQVLAMREFFMDRGCTVLLMQERVPGTGSDISAEGVVHGILLLYQHTPDYGGQRRRLRVHKLRGVAYRDGYHDMVMQTGGLVVYPRLVAADHQEAPPDEVVSSGVDGLDQLLGGGLNRGTSLLIIGPAGVGKSTLAAQFAAAHARRGERAAVYLFDETKRTFVARAEGLRMGLNGLLDQGRLALKQTDPAEFTPGEFAHLIRREVEDRKASLVIIDSLNGYLSGMPDEQHLSMHLHELFSYLSHQNVLTLMTMNQHGFLGHEIQSPAEVSYLADSAVTLRYFEAFGRVRRAISMVKRRLGAHEVLIREMTIAPPGIQVGEALDQFQGLLTGQPTYTGRSEGLGHGAAGKGG